MTRLETELTTVGTDHNDARAKLRELRAARDLLIREFVAAGGTAYRAAQVAQIDGPFAHRIVARGTDTTTDRDLDTVEAELAKVAKRYRALDAQVTELRARRDTLIVKLWRTGKYTKYRLAKLGSLQSQGVAKMLEARNE